MKKIFELQECYGDGWFQGEIRNSYRNLVKILGKPNSKGDSYKVSTEWVVKYLPKGITFTIYDYKETNLYEDGYPSVKEFRNKESYDWHIGGTDEVKDIWDELVYFLIK